MVPHPIRPLGDGGGGDNENVTKLNEDTNECNFEENMEEYSCICMLKTKLGSYL